MSLCTEEVYEMTFEFHTTEQRSSLMKKIKSTETKPEIMLRKALWARGYRYRKNINHLPGKPDIVLTKYKIAIFVDGEFWHGYNWPEKKKRIKANETYWIKKIERNIERDKQNTAELAKAGYLVIRFWEHQILKGIDNCIKEIENLMQQ